MKKISLKNLNLKEIEELSREQLKNVFGGWSGSVTSGGTDEGTYGDWNYTDCGSASGNPDQCSGKCKLNDTDEGSCMTESNGCYCG